MLEIDRCLAEEVQRSSAHELVAYLNGALGDATLSARHRTVRFGQADARWLSVLQIALDRLNCRAWIYREGANRNFWILETSAKFLSFEIDPRCLGSKPEQTAYCRGFFDAEGGMPANAETRLYLQFAQKSRYRVLALQEVLEGLGMRCGKLHNPTTSAPDYWRFYVLASSKVAFLNVVGSWHPRKRELFQRRLDLLIAARARAVASPDPVG